VDVRPSPLAGRWYPRAAAGLCAELDEALLAAAPLSGVAPQQVVGLLVPHAGLHFSGRVAAHAFRAVQGAAPELVVVASPSHFHDEAPLLTSGHAAYATPLGPLPVDQAAVARLGAALAGALGLPAREVLLPLRDDEEHAVEIELPFLQRVLAPGFRLLPLMVADQRAPFARALGAALAEVLRGRRALLVASSDLSHFFSAAQANTLDAELLAQVAALDPPGVLAAQAQGRGQACGAGVIAAMLWAAQSLGATRAQVVAHAHSGQINGDEDQVVGYGAAVVW
jgi:AmmeMemoRadiSam system protein B